MTQNLAPGAATQLVGSTLTQAESGASYPVVTGTITTATSTVTTGNIALAGNVTVYIYGTYAGVNATFEISPDNTNWFPAAMNREDLGWGETTTGVLPANTVRSWTMGAPGLLYFRVRATAWTSGTANVAVLAGTYPFEPMVSNVARKDAGRNQISYYTATLVGTSATDALISLTGYKSNAAVTATTTPAVVTAGKTLRLQSIYILYMGLAAAGLAIVKLRANTGGVAAIGSPQVAQWIIGQPALSASVTAQESIAFPDGLEFAAGTGIGFSLIGIAPNTTPAVAGSVHLQVNGYEY